MADIASQFGARVRKLREAKSLTQEELAFRSSIHRTYIGGIERGERNPCLRNIEAIARALETEIYELFISPHSKRKTK